MGILLANPITQFLGWIMGRIYEILSSIGLDSSVYSIILFTIIVYTLMLPLTINQQKFTRISAVMNPEIQKIQAKYKGKSDQASMLKQQDEMKAVYAKYGTSPTGGCLSSLIQLPILFCLWPVIQNIEKYINESAGYEKFLFFENVKATPSTVINANIKSNIIIAIAAISIPVFSGITQWISMKISQNATQSRDNVNKKDENAMVTQMNGMMKWMPLFSVVMCFSMPMGLGIYWIVSAVVRIVQQLIINKVLDNKSVDDLVAENAKKLETKNSKKKKASSENVNSMAKMYTRRLEEMKAEIYADAEKKEKEEQKRKEIIEKSRTSNAKPGSLAAKANMVRDYNNSHK